MGAPYDIGESCWNCERPLLDHEIDADDCCIYCGASTKDEDEDESDYCGGLEKGSWCADG